MASIIIVKNTHLGTSKSFALDPDSDMSQIRHELMSEGAMASTDVFISNGVIFNQKDEHEITLGAFLDGGKTLIVGPLEAHSAPDDGVLDVRKLGVENPKELFDHIGLFRGIILGENGLERSFENIVIWDMTEVNVNKASPVTMKKTEFTFNEVSLQMKTSGMNSASVSLDTPFGGGEAEYSIRKSKSSSSTKVSQFMISKFVVQRFAVQIDEEDIRIASEFEEEIKNAVKNGTGNEDYYANIIEALDKWGYYVPTSIVLGGGLFASQETQISAFEEAKSEEEEFSVAFKAKFKGIGGGAAYSQAQGEESTRSETSKYQVDTFDQIGGLPVLGADPEGYSKWADSLNDAGNLEVVEYVNLIPSLTLLKDKVLATRCASILMNTCTKSAVRNLQNVLDMWNYGNKVTKKTGNDIFSA